MIILPAFFALVNPVSTIAKPACIKNTKTVPIRTHNVSTDENIFLPPFLYVIKSNTKERFKQAFKFK